MTYIQFFGSIVLATFTGILLSMTLDLYFAVKSKRSQRPRCLNRWKRFYAHLWVFVLTCTVAVLGTFLFADGIG